MFTFFHRDRRDLASKAFFDIFKLGFVGACVSGFFPGFNIGTRLWISGIILGAFWLGLLCCPPPKKENLK